MGDRPLFSTTTTRTSHVGQPGYDNEEIWIRFIKRYEPKLRRLAEKRFPQGRDMVDDVIQTLYGKILTNPMLLAYDPTETHFRTVLTKKFFNIFIDEIRALKTNSKNNYKDNCLALFEMVDLPEYERKRIKLLTLDMVAMNFANLDYDMGRFGPEPIYWDRVVWRDAYVEGKTFAAICIQRKQPFSFVRDSYKRAKERVMHDTEAILKSMGLF